MPQFVLRARNAGHRTTQKCNTLGYGTNIERMVLGCPLMTTNVQKSGRSMYNSPFLEVRWVVPQESELIQSLPVAHCDIITL